MNRIGFGSNAAITGGIIAGRKRIEEQNRKQVDWLHSQQPSPMPSPQPRFSGFFDNLLVSSWIDDAAKKQQTQIDELKRQQDLILQQQRVILNTLAYQNPQIAIQLAQLSQPSSP